MAAQPGTLTPAPQPIGHRPARAFCSRRLCAALALSAGLAGTLAFFRGCDDKVATGNTMPAKIGGKSYKLEIAADEATRIKGLMDRATIAEDGGMVFVFPPSKVRVQGFWMKNCLTDMDILYLDGSGRVLATHTMKVEEPMKLTETLEQYEKRLPTYSSKFPSPIAIEIAPGSVEKLKVKPGDKVEIDVEGLKKMAK